MPRALFHKHDMRLSMRQKRGSLINNGIDLVEVRRARAERRKRDRVEPTVEELVSVSMSRYYCEASVLEMMEHSF